MTEETKMRLLSESPVHGAAALAEIAALKEQNEYIAEMRIRDCEAATKDEAQVAALKKELAALTRKPGDGKP